MRFRPFLASAIAGLSFLSCQSVDPNIQREREENFEFVWGRINEKHYDTNFNGVDWKAVHDRYEPLIRQAENDLEYYRLLNQMLGELKQSHLGVMPPETAMTPEKTTGSSDTSSTAEKPSEKKNTEPGDVGIEMNFLHGKATVTRVEPESPAAAAGLKPGIVLTSIGDYQVPELQAAADHGVERIKAVRRTLGRLQGPVESSIKVSYLEGDLKKEAVLVRKEPVGEKTELGNLTLRTTFETRTLEGEISYIRFSAFMMNLLPKIQEALRNAKSSKGIVFDLRNNPGGVGAMVSPISAYFLKERTDLGTMQIRGGEMKFPVFPKKDVFEGPIAILIDERSASTSEIFAASLQEMGRAFVVGSRSAGAVLPSVIEKMPNGGLFQYVLADFKTPKGVLLEGKGVQPDFWVEPTSQELLEGKDPVLEKAVLEILNRSNLNRKD